MRKLQAHSNLHCFWRWREPTKTAKTDQQVNSKEPKGQPGQRHHHHGVKRPCHWLNRQTDQSPIFFRASCWICDYHQRCVESRKKIWLVSTMFMSLMRVILMDHHGLMLFFLGQPCSTTSDAGISPKNWPFGRSTLTASRPRLMRSGARQRGLLEASYVSLWIHVRWKSFRGSLYSDGYGSIPIIPFLGEWTSIYQLFWCSPGVQGFDTLPDDLSNFRWCFLIWS